MVLISYGHYGADGRHNKRQGEIVDIREEPDIEPKLVGEEEEIIEYEDEVGINPAPVDTIIQEPDGQVKVVDPDGRVLLLDDPRPTDDGEIAVGGMSGADDMTLPSLTVSILTMILYLI